MRFGDVHVYNNLYEQTDATTAASEPGSPFFQYFWGAGKESSIVAESNAVELVDPASASRIIAGWGGTELKATGTLVDGQPADVLAAYNATSATPLSSLRWFTGGLSLPGLLPNRANALSCASQGSVLPTSPNRGVWPSFGLSFGGLADLIAVLFRAPVGLVEPLPETKARPTRCCSRRSPTVALRAPSGARC